jgi:hypothetical protein
MGNLSAMNAQLGRELSSDAKSLIFARTPTRSRLEGRWKEGGNWRQRQQRACR